MNATSEATRSQAGSSPLGNPWVQLIIGVTCMVMIANLQYGWTLFVGPIDAKYHWGRASIQVAFTIFVVLETWLVPIEGYLVDRFGPRWIVVIGGALCGIAWSINSVADSLPMLYFAAALGGIGAGGVYGTCIGNALRWFPGRRGLAAGLTAAGFGAGSALTIVPIANMIKVSGYQHTFLTFGLMQGIVVVVLGFLILVPPASLMTAPSKLAPIAKDFKVADVPVSLVGLTLPALTFALTIDRILNGLCRPFFGWVSDNIGRENTMFIAFLLEGVGILALANLGTNPVLFVILSGIVLFGWAEIYSLFPATVSDTFGTKFATANAGLMYTAKGTAALLVAYANVLSVKTGSWHLVFMLAAGLNLVAAAMAILVLKPMRGSYTNRAETASPAPKLA